MVLDEKHRILSCNREFEDLFQYRQTEIVGQDLDLVVARKRDLSDARSYTQSTMAGQAVHQTATRYRKDGSALDVEVIGVPVVVDGAVVGAYGIYLDISKRKQAEDELRGSELKYRELVENANSIIFRMDPSGRITSFNEFAQRFFGFSEDEILGRNLVGTIVPETDTAGRDLGQMIQEILRDPEKYARNENENVCRDGRRVWIAWTNKPILGPEGLLEEILCIGNDITDLVDAREMSESANRAKSEFLANMSHEIRTPMNGIIGMTELALNTELTPEQREYLDAVKGSAETLLSLINDILDFSKIEAGRLELEEIGFDLRTPIENALDVISLKAHQKGLELTSEIRPDVPTALKGDPGRFRQVLVNLLGNAVKFTEQGEVGLTVETAEEKDNSVWLRCRIRDTGIGIAEEKRKGIFEVFSQVDSSMTRRYGGTGLGLSISRQLVEMMGGRIWVESRLGQGSTFHFTCRFGLSAGARSRRTQP